MVTMCVQVCVRTQTKDKRFSTHSLQGVLSKGEFLLTVQRHVLDLIGSLKQQFKSENKQTHTHTNARNLTQGNSTYVHFIHHRRGLY